jgi:hypothetical protein
MTNELAAGAARNKVTAMAMTRTLVAIWVITQAGTNWGRNKSTPIVALNGDGRRMALQKARRRAEGSLGSNRVNLRKIQRLVFRQSRTRGNLDDKNHGLWTPHIKHPP